MIQIYYTHGTVLYEVVATSHVQSLFPTKLKEELIGLPTLTYHISLPSYSGDSPPGGLS